MKKIEYFPFVTGLKGYAALAIFGRHFLPFRIWNSFGDSVIASLAHFVTVFFFLSGFTLASSILQKKKFHYGRYLLGRFFRLAPLYWIVCIIMFLFSDLAFGAYYQGLSGIPRFDIANLVHHLLFTNGIFAKYQNTLIGVEWTIPIEVMYYLLVPPIVFLATQSLSAMFPLLFLGILFKYYYMQIHLPIYIGNVFHDLWYVERYFVVFCFGILWYVLFFHKRDMVQRTKSIISYILPWIFSFFGLYIVYRESYTFEKFLLPTLIFLAWYIWFLKPRIIKKIFSKAVRTIVGSLDILVAISLFGVYLVSPKTSFEIIISLFVGIIILSCRDQGYVARKIFQNRAIVGVGTISYSIYLLHVPIVKALSHIPSEALTFVITVIAVLGISALSHKYIEAPGRKFGRTIIE